LRLDGWGPNLIWEPAWTTAFSRKVKPGVKENVAKCKKERFPPPKISFSQENWNCGLSEYWAVLLCKKERGIWNPTLDVVKKGSAAGKKSRGGTFIRIGGGGGAVKSTRWVRNFLVSRVGEVGGGGAVVRFRWAPVF